MPRKTFEVKIYKARLARELGTQAGKFLFPACIRCEGAGDEKLFVYFYKPGASVPANYSNSAATLGTTWVPDYHYPWYIDMLRNEKPVFARICSDQLNWNGIMTGAEPVGEEEDVT
jgi:hypothetical protein